MSVSRAVFSVVLLVCCAACEGARILGVFSIPVSSHNILGTRLMKELASRGHDVTMVSPFPQHQSRNYDSVALPGILELHEEMRNNIVDINRRSFIETIPYFARICSQYSESTLNHTNFRKLLASDATFDLIIIEAMFNEAEVGLGYYYGAPVILLSPISSNWMVNKFVANPAPGSTVPDTFLGFPPRMMFVQRLLNTVGTWTMDLFHEFYHLRVQNDLLHAYFPTAFDDITVETLSSAIREVVNNEKYRLQARQRSRLIRDLPHRPIDTAMFWIEYVLRNNDTSHLKSPAIHLEWHQINMLDVYATLAAGVILVAAVPCLLLKKLCRTKKYQQELKKMKEN